jgi:NTP pyrophosphatase (non-canonical NTP hydrolase)
LLEEKFLPSLDITDKTLGYTGYMSIKNTTLRHSAWVASMGWHNKKPLEYLALIASEVGEAVAEAPCNRATPEFGSELMDILLRTVDFAHVHKINLMAEFQCLVHSAPGVTLETIKFSELAYLANQWTSPRNGWNPTVLEVLAGVMPDIAKAMNDCRGSELPTSLGGHLAKVVLKVLALAYQQNIDVDGTINAKVEKNAAKGSRGRVT